MVRDDSKNGIRPKRLLLRLGKKHSQRVIGIFDRVRPLLFRWILGYAARWIRKRLMVGDREESGEKRFTGAVQFSHFLNAAIKQILVTHAPRSREGRVRKIL